MLTPARPLPPLVLGSSSPYRKKLLARLGMPFETLSPAVDETPQAAEDPLALSRRLARAKALEAYRQAPAAVCIGSDQVAVCRGRTLGKPGDRASALEQIHWQMGATTHFHTAVCVAGPASHGPEPLIREGVVTTEVVWRDRSEVRPEAVEAMLDADEPYDCAGAAKSEEGGIILLKALNCPDPTALVGLPLIWLAEALQEWGLGPLSAPALPEG